MSDTAVHESRGQEGLKRAVILGSELPRATAVIRSLGRAGIPMVLLDERQNLPTSTSCYVGRQIRVGPKGDCALKALESLGQDGGGVLIPTNDAYLMLLARNFDRLSRYYTMATPPWNIMEKLLDKAQTYRLAAEAGIKTPAFFTPRDVGELEQIASGLDFENGSYVLRVNVMSPGPADALADRLTTSAGSDKASLENRCMEIFTRTGALPIIQEVVPGGTDACIGVSMVVDHDHQPTICYCVKRLQLYPSMKVSDGAHPYELGINVHCESVHDDEAVDAAGRFVHRAQYYGAMTVEFKRDSRDGSLYLIKADPRVVNSTSLSAALGLDVPTTLYHVLTDGQLSVSPLYRDGVGWIWLDRYMRTVLVNSSHSPVRRQLWRLLKRSNRIKAFAYLSRGDPGPFIKAWLEELLWILKNRREDTLRHHTDLDFENPEVYRRPEQLL